MSNFSESMVNLLKNVDSVLSTKTVVGSPTKIEDTVIVPLVDVSFGIGVGSGGASKDRRSGEGGGLTGKMSPSAVLVIKDGNTKLVSIKNHDTVSKIVDLVPEVLDRFSNKKAELPDDDESIEAAFPDSDKDDNEG
ncbi:GerW family sporulation protein [Lacrimispora saccharolytica]|uniref:GerW family sporulation protein n=1 Tax=Lacrimispora saccharolytica TaxID=84030 RepID=UPI00265CAADD|nr:GerW family sporulation protein [Lacrimispora saccharolytica]MCF2656239.1 GerW family sporulation protein [Lacrimispora saccharolytica]